MMLIVIKYQANGDMLDRCRIRNSLDTYGTVAGKVV